MALILGIETSCDETAAAVVRDGRRALSNVIASQHELHRVYGGVVPEIASRAHLERIDPTIGRALEAAGVGMNDLDAVAVGHQPGLIGSLLVGVSAAKALAWSLGRPLIGVDHVRAHLYAGFMGPADHAGDDPPLDPLERAGDDSPFPALGLVVSGGHTSMYAMRGPTEMTRLGRTIDDAVGEAYDKAAVILGLPYPGGPHLDRLAAGSDADADRFPLPRSLLSPTSLDFSFSGLKTAMLYRVRGTPRGRGDRAEFPRTAQDLSDADRRDLAAAFQRAAIGVLRTKLERAIDHMSERGDRPRSLILGGGVSANSLLRAEALGLGRRHGMAVRLPPMDLCMDNAAMIAGLAHEHLRRGMVSDLRLAAVATTTM